MKKNNSINIKSSNSKSSGRRTQRKSNSKKIYIPKWKILLMCFCVILVCLLLLLITTITNKTENIENQTQNEMVVEIFTNGDRDNQQIIEKSTKPEKPIIEKTQENTKKIIEEKKSESQTNKINNNTETVVAKNVKQEKNETVTNKAEPVKNVTITTPIVPSTTKDDVQKIPQINSFDFPKAVNGAQLVFLFDDGGQSLSQLEKFLNLPFPITVAVLPKLQYSKEAAEKIRKSGNELMLHQPMQALNLSVNPGPGAITPEMTSEEITKILTENINEIGPIAGINNHEGSAITADANKMESIMKITNKYGIFFLDSRTNKDTTVPFVCKELGYTYFERNGNFLDNTKTRENALSMLRKNLDIANKNGVVIMIGHIWSADYLPKLLQDVYPELKAKGYTITTVSKSKGRK